MATAKQLRRKFRLSRQDAEEAAEATYGVGIDAIDDLSVQWTDADPNVGVVVRWTDWSSGVPGDHVARHHRGIGWA